MYVYIDLLDVAQTGEFAGQLQTKEKISLLAQKNITAGRTVEKKVKVF